MSSFKRRLTSTPIPGTRPSAYNSLPLLSTGLSSLDDILGGGLPLSSLLLLDSDTPTSYAQLLLKFWIAQGLECGQEVIVVGSEEGGEGPKEVTEALMGRDGVVGSEVGKGKEKEVENDGESEEGEGGEKGGKMKIAFRYEGMKQHQTTVKDTSNSRTSASDTYCSQFDLTTTRHLSPADRSRLHLINVDTLTEDQDSTQLYTSLLKKIKEIVEKGGYSTTETNKPKRALRIALSSFGSPSWGATTPATLYSFLHTLHHLLRHSTTSCLLTFPSHLFPSPSPSPSPTSSLLLRLSHLSDSVLSLHSFSSSPISLSSFPRHNGLLKVRKLPTIGGLITAGVKLSVLLGQGGGGDGGGGNLGFRVKRKKFVLEMVGGDEPVGGVPGSGSGGGGGGGDERKEGKKVPVVVGEQREGNEVREKRESKVRFGGEIVLGEGGKGKERVSVAKMIHEKPEMFDF